MLFQLLGEQVLLGDIELFLTGVAGKLNYLHSVQQRRRNSIQAVRCCDEEHVAEVQRNLKVVVGECSVLLAVEYLQHCGSRVSLVVAAHLVDLVQQHYGIHALRLLERCGNTSRHCADVGFSVTAYLRLVVNAAQGNTNVLPAQRFGDGAADGGLTHSWRAVKADYLPLDLGSQGTHGDYLHDTLLDLLQTVVVLVKLLLHLVDIQLILGVYVPRKLKHRVEISADNPSLL